MNTFINYNGRLISSTDPFLLAASRAFRYGDGLFETIRLLHGEILLEKFHFERLMQGLERLFFEIPQRFNAALLSQEIKATAQKNRHTAHARVRLSVFRGNGGLYDPEDHSPHYLIETSALDRPVWELNSHGLHTGIFEKGRKSLDSYSNLKSLNYLLYAMAAIDARQRQLNDCLILNSKECICESSISNLFLIKRHVISTPSLEEGCVAGIMRKFMIETLATAGATIRELSISRIDIQEADELLLSNAMGIRWIGNHDGKNYSRKMIGDIHALIGEHLFQNTPTF